MTEDVICGLTVKSIIQVQTSVIRCPRTKEKGKQLEEFLDFWKDPSDLNLFSPISTYKEPGLAVFIHTRYVLEGGIQGSHETPNAHPTDQINRDPVLEN